MDTAYSYGNGQSEARIGKAIKDRRKGLFVATKVQARPGDEAMKILEGSLKRLQIDQFDLVHIHSLTDEADLAKVEAKGGVLDILHKLRDQKVTRFIGITSHTDPTWCWPRRSSGTISDCTQMALNAGMVGMKNGKVGMADRPSHEVRASRPIALHRGQSQEHGRDRDEDLRAGGPDRPGRRSKLMYYSLSLPVSLVTVGMPKPEFIDQNVALAKAFKRMPKAEMQELSQRLSEKNKVALDRFFSDHVDA